MSRLDIHIELDNAAFDGDDCGPEVARILVELARHIKRVSRDDLEGHEPTPRDINGNCVGTVSFEIDYEVEEDETARIEREAREYIDKLGEFDTTALFELLGGDMELIAGKHFLWKRSALKSLVADGNDENELYSWELLDDILMHKRGIRK